jgi:cytochrome P450 family 135
MTTNAAGHDINTPGVGITAPHVKWRQALRPHTLWQGLRVGDAAAIQGLFDRHGDVITLKLPYPLELLDGIRTVVLTRDPNLVKPLLTASAELIDSTRANRITEMVYGNRSMFLIDGPDHMRLRKLVLPRLRGGELDKWGAGLRHSMTREMTRWPGERSVEVHPRMLDVALQSILEITLGLTDKDMPQWQKPMHDLLGAALSAPLAWRYPLRRFGTMRRWASLNNSLTACNDLVYREIAHRRATPDVQRTDLLDLLMHIDGDPLTDQELRDQVFTILLAGHETTTTTVTWAINFLLRNPEALAAAVAEARDTDQDTYLEAVVTETLRMHPPVPVIGRVTRTTFDLGPYRLPPETLILPMIDSIHRQPSLYAEPDVFRPERFLGSRPGMYTLIPFGGGTHRCLGDRLAMFQSKTILHTVLKSLDLHPTGTQRTTRTSLPGNGIRLRATKAVRTA